MNKKCIYGHGRINMIESNVFYYYYDTHARIPDMLVSSLSTGWSVALYARSIVFALHFVMCQVNRNVTGEWGRGRLFGTHRLQVYDNYNRRDEQQWWQIYQPNI